MAIRSTFTTGEVLTAADLTDTIKGAFINTETTTARTLGTADAGNTVTLNNNSGGTVTIPTNTTWGSPLGTLVHLINIGTAGSFTVGTAAGVTLNAASASLAIQEGGTLIKTSTNTWQFVKGGALGGLVYITGNTFTTSSAVNVNNCFTSTYDNYHIQVCRLTSSVGSNIVNLRLRLSGTDASGTDYNRQYLAASSTTVTGLRSTGVTSMSAIGRATTAEQNMLAFDIFNPNRATITAARIYDNEGATGTSISLFLATFSHALTTAYDGFTLFPDSGNMTGTVRVYGYRNS